LAWLSILTRTKAVKRSRHGPPQRGTIAFDISFLLQAPDTAQAWRWRQADPVRQIDIAQGDRRLQLGDDTAVDRIKIGFWHECAFPGAM